MLARCERIIFRTMAKTLPLDDFLLSEDSDDLTTWSSSRVAHYQKANAEKEAAPAGSVRASKDPSWPAKHKDMFRQHNMVYPPNLEAR